MRAAVFALLFTVLAGGSAQAQSQTGQKTTKAEPDITVTGAKVATPEAARRFVREVQVTVEDQFARFTDPICPKVVGVEPKAAQWIADRIRDVAYAVKTIPVAKPGCRPNIALVVTNDADGLVKTLRKDFPGVFGSAGLAAFRDALRDGPVHVWSAVELQGSGGERPWADESHWPRLNVPIATKIDSPNRHVAYQTIVVIDGKAAVGKTLDQLADYVAMRAFGGARPPADGSDADTILTLFDPGAVPPREFTWYDQAFLEALYNSRPNMRAHSMRSAMTQQIIKDTGKAAVAD